MIPPGTNNLTIPEHVWEQLCRHVDQCLPEEACGLLAGTDRRVEIAFPVTNSLHSPVRYRMDPKEQLASFLTIEERGLDLLAIFHSHPKGPEYPSPTDLAEAFYPDSAYLILFPSHENWGVRGYHITPEAVIEIHIVITGTQ